MGRSVSYPRNSVVTFNWFDGEDSWDWDDFLAEKKSIAEHLWPSLSPCSVWLDREDYAILENNHAYLGVSEYCGLVAFWLVPKEENNQLAWRWIKQIEKKFFATFGTLQKVGCFSNGECFFKRVGGVE